MIKSCQVCACPIFGVRDMGMERDGTPNRDYCSSCYRFGKFTRR